ncbi:MAG TPA: glycosyltransferase family A protein [Ginsengibacter sp.]|nr:glycosyltransferase family 2 protein [Chitinophagaceae bacterium]HRP45818.1 glycosyltransferase family A protein [Ginsengibacter sp.]
MSPLVSVLTTAYNREKYIAEAIESVLASTYTNFELIIVDDFSTDNTVNIARSYEAKDKRVKVYVNEKNLGDYPNRNRAASYAKGKYIKFLDSDDIIYPHGLEVMVRSMEQFPEGGFGLSASGYTSSPMPVLLTCKQAYLEHFNSKKHFDRAPGSSIILRDAFQKVGGFSGKRMIGDFEFWLKIGRTFPLVVFQRDLVWDRSHSEQERESEYAKKYEKLRNDILKVAFSDQDCPLTGSEKKAILLKERKKNLKTRLIRLFRNH